MGTTPRLVLRIVAVLCLLIGVVWIGQGAGLIPGSSMTGSSTWLVIGCVMAVVAVVLLVIASRRR